MPVRIHMLPVKPSSGVVRSRIYLWGENDSIPVDKFLRDLSKSRPDDLKRLYALFKKMLDVGRITNSEHFKDVEGHKPLFEFKAHGVRVYCFFDGSDVILVEGDFKKTNKSSAQNRQAIARAENRAAAYWREKKSGRLEMRL
ncbi:MAG: hypothetical protein Q7T82_04915 [Armatimonadota bacterium]|nr:hypothetical protein [Armatimonadota bacterium]